MIRRRVVVAEELDALAGDSFQAKAGAQARLQLDFLARLDDQVGGEENGIEAVANRVHEIAQAAARRAGIADSDADQKARGREGHPESSHGKKYTRSAVFQSTFLWHPADERTSSRLCTGWRDAVVL